MADLTPRMGAAEWRSAQGRAAAQGDRAGAMRWIGGRPVRTSKFGNHRFVTEDGQAYDSRKEFTHHTALLQTRSAQDPGERVVLIRRQLPYLLIEPQPGERAVRYFADFVVDYADGRTEVHDTKSPPTRRNPTYVIKRKLMLQVHGVRVLEF